MTPQPVTIDQLARLYQARNQANSDLAAARRVREPGRLTDALAEAKRLNQAYDAAHKAFKRQQKSAQRARWRTTMINFYLDARQAI